MHSHLSKMRRTSPCTVAVLLWASVRKCYQSSAPVRWCLVTLHHGNPVTFPITGFHGTMFYVTCHMYHVILCHCDLIETGYTAPQVPLVTRRQFQHRLQTVSNVLQFFLCHRASLLRQLDGAVLYASIRLSQCSITDILLSTYRGSTLECHI